MKRFLLIPVIAISACFLLTRPTAAQDKSEWVDLLGNNLKDWERMGTGPNPWRITADRTLICSRASDGYTPDWEFRDGTVKFEYRFQPTREKTGYKASLTVRRTQGFGGCKVALGDDCGTITGTFVSASDGTKDLEVKPVEKPGRPVGEWNAVEIRMENRSVLVTINGKEIGSWDRCPKNHGLVIFEAEGSEIEFRKIHWKEKK